MIAYYKGKIVCTGMHNGSKMFVFSLGTNVALGTLNDLASYSLSQLGAKSLSDFK